MAISHSTRAGQERFVVYLSGEQHEALRVLAFRNRRSMAAEARDALASHLASHLAREGRPAVPPAPESESGAAAPGQE